MRSVHVKDYVEGESSSLASEDEEWRHVRNNTN
jgi:hypothetical protein